MRSGALPWAGRPPVSECTAEGFMFCALPHVRALSPREWVRGATVSAVPLRVPCKNFSVF